MRHDLSWLGSIPSDPLASTSEAHKIAPRFLLGSEGPLNIPFKSGIKCAEKAKGKGKITLIPLN
jgi:hypothetical protein